jgi:hypothetical protein
MQVNKFAVAAIVPLFAGFLLAQQPRTETQTTTTTTTWNGTLIDAGCRSSHTETKETSSDEGGTKTKTTRTETVDCPAAPTTTAFGLLTGDGRYIRFDPASNTRIVEKLKNNKKWMKAINEHGPVVVHVTGKPNGEDVIVLESIE